MNKNENNMAKGVATHIFESGVTKNVKRLSG